MQQRVGAATAGDILELIRSGAARTRREVQDRTGLSRSTLGQRMGQLLAAGYIRESGLIAGATGRPAKLLSFDGAGQFVIAAGLGATHGELAVVDADGEALAQATHEVRIGDGPEETLRRVSRRLTDLIAASGVDRARCAGVGIGIPGPVRFDSGRPNQPPLMPSWHDYPVADYMAELQRLPTFIENDANLAALGEARVRYPESGSLMFVMVGTGIGAGLVLHGTIERGMSGAAGDIGHIRIQGPGTEHRCTCGAVGCLATYASGGALVRRLREAGKDVSTARDVARLVTNRDSLAIKMVHEAGRLLGEVLATSVALLNPSVLVLGGELSGAGPYLVNAVTEAIHERTVPLVHRGLTIAASALGEQAAIHGARHLVIDETFSPATVDARLSLSAPA